jgi:predicted RNA-binding Zn-ribbon protein involved in translation (DUF1610 family)
MNENGFFYCRACGALGWVNLALSRNGRASSLACPRCGEMKLGPLGRLTFE